MTPDQIHLGHTYELTAGDRWTVESSSDGWLWLRNPYGQPVREPVASFALSCVRDITTAPESGQVEKAAEAQSQVASCGRGNGTKMTDPVGAMSLSYESMTKPVIHRNGTAAEELLSQLKAASLALGDAHRALQRSAPNGRDYYPIGPGAVNAATAEHRSRLDRIASVKREIDSLARHVYVAKAEAGK